MEFQSLVVAVIVAAVLLVDRLGGSDELVRRFFQVALGVILAATVVAGTTAFIQPPDEQSSFFADDQTGDPEDLLDRLSVARTIHMAAGILILVFSMVRRPLMPTLAVGGVLGGVLLLLAGGSTGASDSYLTFYASVGSPGASQSADMFHLVVLVAATVGLLTFGHAQFERELYANDGDIAASDDAEY